MTIENRIKRVSRSAQYLILFAAVALPVAVIWVWLMPGEWLAAFGDISLKKRTLGALVSLSGMLVNWAVLWQLWKLFGAYHEHRYFAPENGVRIRNAGWLLLLSIPVKALVHVAVVMILYYPEGTLSIQTGSHDMALLLAGLVMVAIGHVMHLAAQIHAEWQHTY